MNTARLADYYDAAAGSYDEDQFALLGRTRAVVLDQLAQHVRPAEARTIVDFAVGTAETLGALRSLYPEAALAGVDVSRKMLDVALGKVAMEAIHDDVVNVDAHLAPASTDLVLVHYLLGYVEPSAVFDRARRVLRAGGYLSVASSTFECFGAMQQIAEQYLGRAAVQAGSKVPRTTEAMKSELDAAGFDVVALDRVHVDLRFETLPALRTWAIRSAWVGQYFDGVTAAQEADLLARSHEFFPLSDTFDGVVVLARSRAASTEGRRPFQAAHGAR